MRGFDGQLAEQPSNPTLLMECQAAAAEVASAFEQREYSKAIRQIMALADKGNQYIAEQQPWVLAKQNPQDPLVQAVCTTGINVFRLLMVYLKPVLPAMAAKAEAFLNVTPLTWDDAGNVLLSHRINAFTPMMTRVDPASVEALLSASRAEVSSSANSPEPIKSPEPINSPELAKSPELVNSPVANDPIADEIEFNDFIKVDLRIARILEASYVEGADKLLQLTLDLGQGADGQPIQRNVFSGIRSAYRPEDLQGRLTVLAANLKPRKMKFGLSEGMVLAAGPGGADIWLLSPDQGAEPGMRIV